MNTRRAQSLVEYSAVLAVVLAAIIGMSTYLRRGVQAAVKGTTNDLLSVTARASGETVDQVADRTQERGIRDLSALLAAGSLQLDQSTRDLQPGTVEDTWAATAGGPATRQTGRSSSTESTNVSIFRELEGKPTPVGRQ